MQKEIRQKCFESCFDSQDPEQITEAQDKLTKLAVEKEKVAMLLLKKKKKKKAVKT